MSHDLSDPALLFVMLGNGGIHVFLLARLSVVSKSVISSEVETPWVPSALKPGTLQSLSCIILLPGLFSG
jgi:hypothetical protein